MKTIFVCLLSLTGAGIAGDPVPMPSTGGFLYQTAESAKKPLPPAKEPINKRNTVLALAAMGAVVAARGMWRRRNGGD